MGTKPAPETGAQPVRVIRYGVDEPLPERRELRAGPMSAILENGDLRYVKVGDVEVVRRLYMAVRDRDWDTIEPTFTSFRVQAGGDSFQVGFTAEHVRGDVDFAWEGTIVGTPDGVITFAMDGGPRTSFFRNRIGFCVLHPMALAGVPVEVETPAGRVEGAFPVRISPNQPFVDMVSIAHEAGPDTRLSIRFEGDLFEMEDQRNWSDASYKTYCTPLRLPYPVQVDPGQRISQRVTMSAIGSAGKRAAGTGDAADVEIGTEAVASLPPIGLGAATHGRALTALETERLRVLRPAHLHLGIDLGAADWGERLGRTAADAAALGAAIELAVVADEAGDGFDRLAARLQRLDVAVARMFVFPSVTHPIVFPRTDLATTGPVLARMRAAFERAGLDVPLGGGTRAYFTELNRAAETLPLSELAVVTYTLNPQVHAFDNASVVETLAAQPETVASARAIAGDRPLAVGPVTLRPPFNPNATGPAPDAGSDVLPPAVDPRQLSLFGAGWMVGSIGRLAGAGVSSLTYYETTGWRGVMERAEGLTRRGLFPSRPEQLFPLYHVLAAVADFRGARVLPVRLRDPLATEALALRERNRVRILVASFADELRSVTVTVPPLQGATVRYLDETNAEAGQTDPELLTADGGAPVDATSGHIRLALRPFGIARIDGRPGAG